MTTTLTVTLGREDRLREETVDRIRAAEKGEDIEDDQPVLNFENYAALSRLLSEKNLELLEAIATHEPASMREAAEIVDRNFKEVHRNLTELAELGVIDLVTDGRAKRPVVRYESIEIDIHLAGVDA